nr:MAG TPA: Single strand binding protein [Caudoviricetes sp.]
MGSYSLTSIDVKRKQPKPPATEVHVGINGVMQMLGGIGDSKQQAASRQSQKPQQQSSPAQHNEPPMDFDDDIPFAPVTLPFPRHAIHAI